jgi:hypothetical protein
MCAKVINAVLILQVLVHSIFGCCWHHDHATEPTVCSDRADAPAQVQTCKCRHHDHFVDLEHVSGAMAKTQSPPQPHRHPPCDEEQCLFVHAPVGDASRAALLALDVSCVLPTQILNFPVVSTGARIPERSPVWWTSAERCALFEAWLI